MREGTLPTIAITLGDPAGIGPEVIVKALASGKLRERCVPLIVGTADLVRAACNLFAPNLSLKIVSEDEVTQLSTSTNKIVSVLDVHGPDPATLAQGMATSEGGAASISYIKTAGRLALSGGVDGLATAPINKEAVQLAGSEDIGHLEILSRLAGTNDTATMLTAGPLRAVHLTTHVPLHDAASYVRRDLILARFRLTHRSLAAWGFPQPRIAVAALNPHGGDGGLLGREEIEEIGPAVADAQAEGIAATGPFPADSIFLRALQGDFDAILVLYHDQGHIPIKLHDFHGSVSVNLGLPFVRTSVDHGTAYDIAGKGIAEPLGMIEAIALAANLTSGQGFTTAVASTSASVHS